MTHKQGNIVLGIVSGVFLLVIAAMAWKWYDAKTKGLLLDPKTGLPFIDPKTGKPYPVVLASASSSTAATGSGALAATATQRNIIIPAGSIVPQGTYIRANGSVVDVSALGN